MSNFPKDQLPAEYNQDILTRQMEDIYQRLGEIDDVGGEVSSLMEELQKMQSELEGLLREKAGNRMLENTVLPVPENLEIKKYKWVPLVFVRCKHLEIIKYPYVWGFQFFISQQHDFTPMERSGEMTLTGTHSGVNGTTLSHTADLTLSTEPGLGAYYTNLPFWKDMNIYVAGSYTAAVTNITQSTTGAATGFAPNVDPWNISTNINWANGDSYVVKTRMKGNLIHQGPLPFAVYILKPSQGWPSNMLWDSVSYYCKARTYGIGGPKSGRLSDFVCASTTTAEDYDTTGPDVTETNCIDSIRVGWTSWGTVDNQIDYLRLYRTTANSSNLITNDTYLIEDRLYGTEYEDKVYHPTYNPNGVSPGTTYWYWLRSVDVGGSVGNNGASKSGIINIANTPNIYNGAEEEDRGWARTKSWIIYWTTVGGATGYFVRYRFKLNGTYGIWTTPVYIPHTTEFGQIGGEDIQSYTFHHLRAGRTYTFAVKATWCPTITNVESIWETQDYTINNTSAPAAPT